MHERCKDSHDPARLALGLHAWIHGGASISLQQSWLVAGAKPRKSKRGSHGMNRIPASFQIPLVCLGLRLLSASRLHSSEKLFAFDFYYVPGVLFFSTCGDSSGF